MLLERLKVIVDDRIVDRARVDARFDAGSRRPAQQRDHIGRVVCNDREPLDPPGCKSSRERARARQRSAVGQVISAADDERLVGGRLCILTQKSEEVHDQVLYQSTISPTVRGSTPSLYG